MNINKRGQGLVEYSLIIGLVALAVVASLGLFSTGLSTGMSTTFNTILTALAS